MLCQPAQTTGSMPPGGAAAAKVFMVNAYLSAYYKK
jgi:hypothetical protein